MSLMSSAFAPVVGAPISAAMVISSSFFRRSSSGRVSLAVVSLSELLLLLPSEEESGVGDRARLCGALGGITFLRASYFLLYPIFLI